MFGRMKRYRVREGSPADIMRALALGAGFWGIIFWAIITTYPV